MTDTQMWKPDGTAEGLESSTWSTEGTPSNFVAYVLLDSYSTHTDPQVVVHEQVDLGSSPAITSPGDLREAMVELRQELELWSRLVKAGFNVAEVDDVKPLAQALSSPSVGNVQGSTQRLRALRQVFLFSLLEFGAWTSAMRAMDPNTETIEVPARFIIRDQAETPIEIREYADCLPALVQSLES